MSLWTPPGGIVARRDSPEVVIPDNSNSVARAPGTTAWTLSAAFSLITAETTEDYTLNALNLTINHQATLTADATLVVNALWSVHLYTGASGAEVELTRFIAANSGRVVMSGLIGTATAIVASVSASQIPSFPLFIPKGTRLSVKNACSATTAEIPSRSTINSVLVYPARSPELIPVFDNPAFALGGMPGASTVFPSLSALVLTGGANPWDYGTYVTAVDALDADYLITGVAAMTQDLTAVPQSYCVQLALGQAGAEVVQSRSMWHRVSANVPAGGVKVFTHPFIAYAGERLSACVKESTGVIAHTAIIYAVKLGRGL